MVPIIVNVVLFTALIGWAAGYVADLVEVSMRHLPGWLDWLSWLLWPVFVLAAVLALALGFTFLANLIASPFNGLLASQAELVMTGAAPPDSGKPLWLEVAAAPLQELGKLAWFATFAIPLLLLFLVPGVNAAAPFLWLGFSAWMLCVEYADYPMGNTGMRFREQRRVLARRRFVALGFGGTVLLLTSIPLVNLLVMPAAVIGATAMWVAEHRESAAIR